MKRKREMPKSALKIYLPKCIPSLVICYFFQEFSYINEYYSCLNGYIFAKLTQIVFLINVHILICQHAKWD